MKIGILVSSSALFPTCGMQFCDGAELGFKKHSEQEVNITRESADTGTNPEAIIAKANKLLVQDGADIVIAYVSTAAYHGLATLFTEHKKILVLAEMGGTIFFDRVVSPYVFYHSLNEWVAARVTGRYLGKKGHRNVLNALSFMEAGYHLNHTFLNGFIQEDGNSGEFYVAPLKPEQKYYDGLAAAIQTGKHDLIYCGFDGGDAALFLENMGTALADSKIAITGPALLTIPPVAGKYGDRIPGAITASAYYPELDNLSNKSFIEEFGKISEHEADRFALLGYECGMIVSMCATLNENNKFSAKAFVEKMQNGNFITPRGRLKYHPEKHHTLSAIHIAVLEESGEKYCNHVISTVEPEDMEEWRADINNQPPGGWLNPYPCT